MTKKQHFRGSVMAEMVFAIPLLLVVLLAMMGMGRAIERTVQVNKSARYEAGRTAARNATYPSGDTREGPSINTVFNKDKATNITAEHGGGFDGEANDLLVQEAMNEDTRTGEMVEQALDSFPAGNNARITTDFPEETNRIYALFNGSIEYHTRRMSHEWKFASHWLNLTDEQLISHEIYCRRSIEEYNHIGYMDMRYDYEGVLDPAVRRANWGGPWMLTAARDTFLVELDGQMEALSNGGNYIASSIRDMYTQRPRYRGPGFPYGIYHPEYLCVTGD